jgi:predicted PurR-regulated permease PerM
MSFPNPSEKQARIIWSGLTIVSIALSFGVIGAVVYGIATMLAHLSPILMPIAVAGILACLLDPAVCFFERMKVPRIRAILLVYVITGSAVIATVGTIIPAAYVQAVGLIGDAQSRYTEFRRTHPATDSPANADTKAHPESETPPTNSIPAIPQMRPAPEVIPGTDLLHTPGGELASDESGWFSGALTKVKSIWKDPKYKDHVEGFEKTMKDVLTKLGDWLFHQVVAVSHLLGWALGIVLIPVYIFYFLRSKDGILKNWKDYLPIHHESEFRKDFVFIVNSINEAMLVFFRGQILVGVISGVLMAVGLSLQGVKYSVLIGVLAAVLGVVPYLGFLMSTVLAIVVSIVQFGGTTQPMITTGICLAVHWIEGFGYQPRIIGDRVGLHPMMIIVSLFLGATLLGGLLGGLLGIPLAALIKTLMKRYVWVKYRHEVEGSDEDDAPEPAGAT